MLGIGPWHVDDLVAETFAHGGPSGDLATDMFVVIEHLLDKPSFGKARVAAAFELARREPRLLMRHLTWMEQHRSRIEALVSRRLGDSGERAGDLVGMLLMFMTHLTFVRWEAMGGTGDARDHLSSVVADLRTLLGAGTPPDPAAPAP